MDWSNERYVRLYTRDTDDWLALKWEGKALLPLMLRKADRSGFLATKRSAIGVAAQTGLPLELVEVGLADLLRDGCVIAVEDGYLLPNFIPAQEATASGALRSREHRERVRASKLHPQLAQQNVPEARQGVTGEERDVTQPQRDETARNGAQLQPSRAVPSLATPNQAEPAVTADTTTDARALTIAANKAIAEKFGEQTNPLRAGHGKSHDLARSLAEAGIPVAFAVRSIARQVNSLVKPVRSIAYFLPGITDDWSAHNERLAAAGADPVQPLEERPGKSSGTSFTDGLRAIRGGEQ